MFLIYIHDILSFDSTDGQTLNAYLFLACGCVGWCARDGVGVCGVCGLRDAGDVRVRIIVCMW